jgi:hypothetical protein
VSVLRVFGVMAFAVACLVLRWAPARGETAPASPSFLVFAGTDLWRYGAFLYGGGLWSPAGVDRDGFTLKMLLNGGAYTYSSGDLHTGIDGEMASAAVLPGWRFSRDTLTVSLFAGPVAQDYRLSPFDPGSKLHGGYIGAQFATELWYQPAANLMAAVSGAVATIGPTGSVRAAVGLRAFDAMFVGPETAMLWCGDFQQFQAGGHITAFHFNAAEWSAGAGWTLTSDHRTGPYLRIGASVKY